MPAKNIKMKFRRRRHHYFKKTNVLSPHTQGRNDLMMESSSSQRVDEITDIVQKEPNLNCAKNKANSKTHLSKAKRNSKKANKLEGTKGILSKNSEENDYNASNMLEVSPARETGIVKYVDVISSKSGQQMKQEITEVATSKINEIEMKTTNIIEILEIYDDDKSIDIQEVTITENSGLNLFATNQEKFHEEMHSETNISTPEDIKRTKLTKSDKNYNGTIEIVKVAPVSKSESIEIKSESVQYFKEVTKAEEFINHNLFENEKETSCQIETETFPAFELESPNNKVESVEVRAICKSDNTQQYNVSEENKSCSFPAIINETLQSETNFTKYIMPQPTDNSKNLENITNQSVCENDKTTGIIEILPVSNPENINEFTITEENVCNTSSTNHKGKVNELNRSEINVSSLEIIKDSEKLLEIEKNVCTNDYAMPAVKIEPINPNMLETDNIPFPKHVQCCEKFGKNDFIEYNIYKNEEKNNFQSEIGAQLLAYDTERTQNQVEVVEISATHKKDNVAEELIENLSIYSSNVRETNNHVEVEVAHTGDFEHRLSNENYESNAVYHHVGNSDNAIKPGHSLNQQQNIDLNLDTYNDDSLNQNFTQDEIFQPLTESGEENVQTNILHIIKMVTQLKQDDKLFIKLLEKMLRIYEGSTDESALKIAILELFVKCLETHNPEKLNGLLHLCKANLNGDD